MQRTNFQIPDAINSSTTKDFTQIPNSLLRNPDVSSKAKVILGILLSNKEGWKSHLASLMGFMKESRDTITSGLKELTELGYLVRVKYRNKETKRIIGSLWCYVDIPFNFDFSESSKMLETKGLEMVFQSFEKPNTGKPEPGKPSCGFSVANNTNSNNTNIVKTDVLTPSDDLEKLITINYFEKFWNIYPKKADKGKALDAWKKLCNKNDGKERPSWITIKKAILGQIKSERWSVPSYIPNPSTWINQNRWLDDPVEMKLFKKDFDQPTKKYQGGYRSPGMVYREPDQIV